jgi:hypothetical protein
MSRFQPLAASPATALLTPAPQTSSAFPPAMAALNESSASDGFGIEKGIKLLQR